MRRLTLLTVSLFVMAPASLGWAYPWDKDMVDQPSEKAQESIAPPGPGSVPTNGGETVPQPLTDQESTDMKEAAAAIENPVAATAEVLTQRPAQHGQQKGRAEHEDHGLAPVGLDLLPHIS